MNEAEREVITAKYKKRYGKGEKGDGSKRISWKLICIETKEHPEKPKALITGIVDTIFPTGDVAFKEITRVDLWNMDNNTLKKVDIPEPYKKAKKLVFRREIIASVIYLEKNGETDE